MGSKVGINKMILMFFKLILNMFPIYMTMKQISETDSKTMLEVRTS